MKRYIYGMIAALVLFVGVGTASADGGMMTTAYSAPTPVVAGASMVMSDEDIAARIAVLKKIVTLTSEVQALMMQLPEPTESDEGTLTVVVKENAIKDCRDQQGVTGSDCVRHSGKIGDSTISLSTIEGFTYDPLFMYHLTLLRVRAATYGEVDKVQYDYYLRRIEQVDYVGS